ncbi:hypothetical protein L873DRAFT_1773618 [Choiromyces venosus 120613-1]|uniref:GPN-loop GTPase n=1 Tax=Choiromyces venosus 120613-1 TaxID=1336337 RepID=A0A3N4JCJ1_9PEZI|nr:hypothetical protein L873DRAFT_1773618 [Choiromyces venosus 120613-1]
MASSAPVGESLQAGSSSSAPESSPGASRDGPPPAIICIGMAGSGKTTFMQRLNAHLHAKKQPPYIINLDPAVKTVPFARNIDIRDSVNYKEVMKQYNLGPNGGIMTCLNLFATKVDQVVGILEKRASSINSILVDTPGQIECFVWSASGAIITDAIASGFPTVIAYMIDTPRTKAPATFMSNMLYACSILYKTKLPMILVFNKTDAQDADFAKEWMTDFEAFQKALQEEEGNDEGVGGSGYMASLLNSMSLMLDEFYKHLDLVAVSAMTGAGIDDFMKAVEGKCIEYEKDYKPEMEKARKRREEQKLEEKEKELGRLMKDIDVSGGGKKKEEPAVMSDIESSDEEGGQGMLERDEDEEMQDEEGLQEKYERLGKQVEPGTDPLLDASLKRYLNVNG